MQKAYRPWLIKYSIHCPIWGYSIPGWWGVPHPWIWGTPSWCTPSPILTWLGVPHPWTGGTPNMLVPPILPWLGGTLSQDGGNPGYPSSWPGWGNPPPIWTWPGYSPVLTWPGYCPVLAWDQYWGTSPPPQKGHETSGSIMGWRWGSPPRKDMGLMEVLCDGDGDGVPPVCGQTEKITYRFVQRTWSVIMLETALLTSW